MADRLRVVAQNAASVPGNLKLFGRRAALIGGVFMLFLEVQRLFGLRAALNQ